MHKFFISILFLCICCLAIAQSNPASTSHVVEKGETLYSISKLYHVTVEALETANKSSLGVNDKLSIGQKLTIPASSTHAPGGKSETTAPVKPQNSPDSHPANVSTASGTMVHIVQKGETVYSIAKANGLTWKQIKDANHLTDDTKLQLGQKLIIPSQSMEAIYKPVPHERKPEPAAPKPEPVTTPTAQVKEHPSSQPPVIKSTSVQQETVAPSVPATQKTTTAPVKAEASKQIKPTENPSSPPPAAINNENTGPSDYAAVFTRYDNSGKKKVVYRGIGTFMQVENHGNQFFALYNYAAMGTILKVTNLMSKQSIYVKVIGKVPAEDTRSDVMLKVSSEAAGKLKVTEDKFLVEVAAYTKE